MSVPVKMEAWIHAVLPVIHEAGRRIKNAGDYETPFNEVFRLMNNPPEDMNFERSEGVKNDISCMIEEAKKSIAEAKPMRAYRALMHVWYGVYSGVGDLGGFARRELAYDDIREIKKQNEIK